MPNTHTPTASRMSFERNEWKVEEDETVIVDPSARKQAVIFPYFNPK